MLVIGQRSKVKLSINGVDLSSYLYDYQLSYSSVEITTGVSYITGTVTLKKPFGDNSVSFDPRFSTNFTPGRIVELKVGNDYLPLGHLRVINSNFDLKSTLTIDVGCVLSANNSKTLKTTSLCIDFGANFPVGNVVRTLLLASGLTELEFSNAGILDLNKYKLAEPFQINDGQSLIQAAAQLCGQFGRLMYQDNKGEVKFRLVFVDNVNYTLVSDQKELISYTISSQPEQAIKLLEVDYNDSKVLGILQTTSSSVRSGDISIEALTERDEDNNKLTTVISEFRDIGNGQVALVNETTTVSQFENLTNTPRTGQLALANDCFPSNNSRLLSKITTTKSDNTVVLQAWLYYKAAATTPTGFSVSGVITSAQVVETYNYGNNSVTIDVTEFQPIAKVVPLIGDRQLTSTNTAITDIPPLTQIPANKVVTVYSRSLNNSTKWTKATSEYINKSLFEPGTIEARSQLPAANLQDIIENGQELINISNTIEFNQSAFEAETFAVDVEVISEPINFTIGSDFNKGIVTNLSLGNYYNPDPSLLQDIAINYFNFVNGRIFGCQVGARLHQNINFWDTFTPLSYSKVIETTGSQVVYRIDSPSITYSATELAISYTGSIVGTTTDIGANYYAESVTPLANQNIASSNQIYYFDDLTYTITESFSIS